MKETYAQRKRLIHLEMEEVIYPLQSETFLESCQTSKIERFSRLVKKFQPLTILEKCSILDAWQVSEYITDNGNDRPAKFNSIFE